MTSTIGVVGGRGVVGQEVMKLLRAHPTLSLDFGADERLTPEQAVARPVDLLVLCAPNGVSPAYVTAFTREKPNVPIVDLSSDHRFDDGWIYGLPERNREKLARATRIANPGCYATGAQLALDPLLDLVDGAPSIFGVSGYSGAGSTPSPKNDPKRLADNLLPYDLVGHTQEREISQQLGRAVAFMPHVAPFFAGIALTITFALKAACTVDDLRARARKRYARERLVKVIDSIPEVKDARGRHDVLIGGFAVDQQNKRAVVVAALDNLLKGAATQAVQNVNLALGFDEQTGIPGDPR